MTKYEFSKTADRALTYVGIKQGSKMHKRIVDAYNTIKPLPRGYKVKYTDNWCATFISYMLFTSNTKRKIYECSAEKMRQKAKKYWLYDNKKGQKNDIIFYDWNNDKWCDHVGIIVYSDKKYYKVVEGNKDKKVGVRIINKNSSYIFSIARL